MKKIHWEVSLICEKVFFSTYFCIFHCILPVPTPQYTIILLLLPNIMLRYCWFTYTEHLTSRYVKKIHWDFLVYCNYAILLPIFSNKKLRFWGSRSLEESKWCHYVMVEPDNNLKLLPPTILDINKAFEHIDMLFIAYGSSLTQLSTLLGSDVGVLGQVWSWNDVITSCGWGWQPPQTASCIYIRHIRNVWAHWYAVNRHKVAALHSYPPYLAQILGFWVNYGVEMMSLHHGWGWQLP